ncbi:hypothetical protein G3I44_13525 [Halogeometricum borinquense]|uniref:Uncharacterized protein n=1 Tax=Halogeometricum borinquense TaxID=60847 RepID=A0A6C0UKV7_9EURY|nr:hypothetical protein [Halogeometricum borinquense]QIB75213.1 hypothetical protein G3I44_13525 [Halogeometricum borinquense]
MMENMKNVDETTSYFLTEEQDAGIVVTEDDGEILRLESDEVEITFDQLDMLYFIHTHEPVSLSDIRKEYDAGSRQIVGLLDSLFSRGEIYEQLADEIRVVPTQPDVEK